MPRPAPSASLRRLGPVSYLRTRGLYRGILGGNRNWALVFVALWGAQRVRRFFGRSEETVLVEALRPGESMVITPLLPERRSRRRRS